MPRTFLAIFVLLAAGATILAFKILGAWALLLLPVAAILASYVTAKLFGARLLAKAVRAPFVAKGAPLRDASVDVHSIEQHAEPPVAARDPEEEEDAPERAAARPGWRYFTLHATIAPRSEPPGPFRLWAPSEVLVEPAGTPAEPDADAEEACEVLRVELEQDGAMVPDDGVEVPGSQKLRLAIGVQPDVRELQFRYYFESFGRVVLPA